MLVLSSNQSLHLMELMGDLASFNESRYQDIIHALTNCIADAKSDADRQPLIQLLQLASSVWYHNEVIVQASGQLTKSLEG